MSLMYGHRCIYCGKGIPGDIGLSCADCNKHGFDEFRYADEIQPNLAKMMEEVENGARTSGTTQTKEEVYRLKEMNADARKEYRWPNQDELKQRRTGRIYHMSEFLRKLRDAGLNVWYGNFSGMQGTIGLYTFHEKWKLTDACSHEWGKPHYVGFVQIPFMQEYEELHFDRYDVPLGPKRRGWRTIGLRLIEQNVISEQKFHEVFGEPPVNLVTQRYWRYLQYLRHRPL